MRYIYIYFEQSFESPARVRVYVYACVRARSHSFAFPLSLSLGFSVLRSYVISSHLLLRLLSFHYSINRSYYGINQKLLR